jgi:hypothetical protein
VQFAFVAHRADADKSLGGVLLKQPFATHAKPLKISTPRSSYDLSWTAVMARILRVTSQLSILPKKHIFNMLCWMSVGIFSIIRSIDESTGV